MPCLGFVKTSQWACRESACGDAAARTASARAVAFVGPARTPYSFHVPVWARAARPADRGAGTGAEDLSRAHGGMDGRSSSAADVVVRAGYFACVWFLLLGATHDAVVADLTSGGSAVVADLTSGPGAGGSESAAFLIADGAAVFTREIEALPLLAPVLRVTPAERRWRRKQRTRLGK